MVTGGAVNPIGEIEIGNSNQKIDVLKSKSIQSESIGYVYYGDILPYYGKEGRFYVVNKNDQQV